MELRQIEVFLPQAQEKKVQEIIPEHSFLELWEYNLSSGQVLIKILLPAKDAETVIDLLESYFSNCEEFHLLLLAVEASIPRQKQFEDNDSEDKTPQIELNPESSRINRQELYQDVSKTVVLTLNHLVMVLLSTIIATIGLLRNDGTIIIGAMVIAPLLGPNMALALATTLGDIELGKKAIKIGAVGLSLALIFSILVGYIVPVDPTLPEIVSRTQVSGSDVILAFASGIAGALSFTAGTTSAIVGVMVAVALLPPLVTFGMLLGAGDWPAAFGAMLLLLINLICLNLAGILTFAVQKIRPGQWWEVYQAEKVTKAAFWLWIFLLSTVILGIVIWHRNYQI